MVLVRIGNDGVGYQDIVGRDDITALLTLLLVLMVLDKVDDDNDNDDNYDDKNDDKDDDNDNDNGACLLKGLLGSMSKGKVKKKITSGVCQEM